MESDWSVDTSYSEFGPCHVRGASSSVPGTASNLRGDGRPGLHDHAWGTASGLNGSPQSFFAGESLMDELAAKMGEDPLELRARNVYRPGDTTPTGQTPDVLCFAEMIDKLRPLYQEAKKKAKAGSTGDVRRGVGISLGIYGCGLDGPDSSEIRVELNPDNSVTVFSAGEDHGQGADIGVWVRPTRP
jgi:aldehyde oxidoreductase